MDEFVDLDLHSREKTRNHHLEARIELEQEARQPQTDEHHRRECHKLQLQLPRHLHPRRRCIQVERRVKSSARRRAPSFGLFKVILLAVAAILDACECTSNHQQRHNGGALQTVASGRTDHRPNAHVARHLSADVDENHNHHAARPADLKVGHDNDRRASMGAHGGSGKRQPARRSGELVSADYEPGFELNNNEQANTPTLATDGAQFATPSENGLETAAAAPDSAPWSLMAAHNLSSPAAAAKSLAKWSARHDGDEDDEQELAGRNWSSAARPAAPTRTPADRTDNEVPATTLDRRWPMPSPRLSTIKGDNRSRTAPKWTEVASATPPVAADGRHLAPPATKTKETGKSGANLKAPVHAAHDRYSSSPADSDEQAAATAQRRRVELDRNETSRLFANHFKYIKPKKATAGKNSKWQELDHHEVTRSNATRADGSKLGQQTLSSASVSTDTPESFPPKGGRDEFKVANSTAARLPSSGRVRQLGEQDNETHDERTPTSALIRQTTSEFKSNYSRQLAAGDAWQRSDSSARSTKRRNVWQIVAQKPSTSVSHASPVALLRLSLTGDKFAPLSDKLRAKQDGPSALARFSTGASGPSGALMTNSSSSLLHLPLSNYINPYAAYGTSDKQAIVGEQQAAQGASIVRTGFSLPLRQQAWPQMDSHHNHHIPLQNLRNLVPAAMALLAQAHGSADTSAPSSKQLMALNQLRSLLTGSQQQSQQPSAAPALQADQMLGAASHLAATPADINSYATALDYADLRHPAATSAVAASSSPPSPGHNQERAESSSAGGQQASLATGEQLDGHQQTSGRQQQQSASGAPPGVASSERSEEQQPYQAYQAYQADQAAYYADRGQLNSSAHYYAPLGSLGAQPEPSVYQNSRSSLAHEPYLRAEHKSVGGLDAFEELTGPLASSEYERDLADLDEEFNRHTVFRPSRASLAESGAGEGAGSAAASSHQYASGLMGDSMLSYSPERYEPLRYHASRPRPSMSSYLSEPGDYLTMAGSMSSAIPRPYRHSHSAHHAQRSALANGDSLDLWPPEAGYDFSPLASYLAPGHFVPSAATHSTGYRWRPRYIAHSHPGASGQRTLTAYTPGAAAFAASPSALVSGGLSPAAYLSAAASEQPAFSLVPGFGPAAPTETVSFAMSPLAAAAAAAATALAAADKNRHHHGHAWTFTLPRLASALTAAQFSASSSPSSGHLAAAASSSSGQPSAQSPYQPATLHYRPHGAASTAAASSAGSYLFSPLPLYAIAPRPALTTAASSASPSAIPYAFHAGAGAPLIAYRPAGSAPYLTAASFAYPFRLPLGGPAALASSPFGGHHHSAIGYYQQHQPAPVARPSSSGATGRLHPAGSKPAGHLADLQFAESKSKWNGNGAEAPSSNLASKTNGSKPATGLTQMARNLSKKMFGSASQPRPQFVAPPADLFGGGGGVGASAPVAASQQTANGQFAFLGGSANAVAHGQLNTSAGRAIQLAS